MIAETIQNLHSTFFVLNTESQHNVGGAGQVQEYMFSLLMDACQSSWSQYFVTCVIVGFTAAKTNTVTVTDSGLY